MGRSSLLSPFISHTDACVHCWATSPDIPSSYLVSLLLIMDYDNLGVQIEGELPDGAPHMITCK